ncbi:MAG: type II toxin-antitoxin system RelE/ParE family toxin [Moritella sp.]|uniref:type II toxin-antitoxin system RelE family toxin n=1 Tax=Moritella sp. TaxID=78556 RepID=UPI001D2B35D4|nr:type II toxin-antitoxin system RelE/ParE family toxin [Moritella sp.]
MVNYKVTSKKPVVQGLREIPNQHIVKMLNRIHKRAENPKDERCIKLSRSERYRIRQGIYCILYEIINPRIVVQGVKVGHRSSVYDS